MSVLDYLFPTWAEGAAWMTKALDEAIHVRDKNVVKTGGVTVLVQSFQPADREGIYATVVIAKKASLEDWEWGDD